MNVVGRFLLMWTIALGVVGLCLIGGAVLVACALAVAFWTTVHLQGLLEPVVWRAWLALTLTIGTVLTFHPETYPKWLYGEDD